MPRSRAQLERLEQVILAGFTHEPVIALSEALTALAPAGLTRCFYADNGSAAVEVALKMSFHYWRNSGRSAKHRFITLANSYHGETLGALAVGNVELYKEIYRPLLMDVITVPSPDCYERAPRARAGEQYSRRRFADMEAALARARARDLRGDRRAAGAVRGRHAHVRPGVPRRCCARPAIATRCT